MLGRYLTVTTALCVGCAGDPGDPAPKDTGDTGEAPEFADAICSPPCTASLAGASARMLAEGEGDKAGYSLARAGDLDGDGADDLLVGARFGRGVGSAYVVRGPIAGESSLADAATILRGEVEDDQLGGRVTVPGDLDRDGHLDLLLGALGTDRGAENAGGVAVFFGPVSGTLTYSDADAFFHGELADDAAGDAVASAGDTDGDGVVDLVVGASNADAAAEGAGVVYLLRGPASTSGALADAEARLFGEATGDNAGNAVIGLGDADGDGLDDLAAGAPHRENQGVVSEGAAYVALAPISGTTSLADADGIHRGEQAGHRAGADVAGGVDVDGDGRPDLAVGAHSWGEAEEGAMYVVWGPATGDASLADAPLRIYGESPTGWLGVRLDFVGDVDGDGTIDLAVGAKWADDTGEDAGATYVFLGPLPEGTHLASDADVTLLGAAVGDQSGMDVASGGDLTGDGVDDLVVGAQGESTLGLDAGAAYVVSLAR
ncbi:MAG: VCBS repeat-containing protein [Myxococcota bacterium]